MTYALEIADLKKTYPGGTEALKGISLSVQEGDFYACLLYTSPSPRDRQKSRMPSSA